MKERLTSRKLLHLFLVLGVLSALFIYRTWFDAVVTPKNEPGNVQICDLADGRCSAMIANKQVTVAIAEGPVRAERDMELQLEGDPGVMPVKAWLEGRDMFMGTIPVVFERGDNGWHGTVQVGSCTSEVMVWLLNIEWSHGQRQQMALSVAR